MAMDASAQTLAIRQALFSLARERPWNEIGLSDVAAAAGLSLAELRAHAASKAAIIEDFSRDIDAAMLLLLRKEPPAGEAHDRLFDTVLKRLEIMAPYRRELAGIIAARPGNPAEALNLLQSASTTAGWMLAAAGLEGDPAWKGPGFAGLLYAYGRTLRVWAKDDDPGLNRTMAALDRELRDAAGRSARLAGARRFGGALLGAAQTFIREAFRPRQEPP